MSNGQALSQSKEDPFIEVTGNAEIEIIPDEIYVDLIVEERYEGKEKLTLDMQEERLKKSLQEIGIELRNLSLSAANGTYVRVKRRSKDVLSQKNFRLKLSDAATVDKLFEQLDKLDMSNASISMMNHSKMDSIRREIRIRAITAAKDKADYLLKAIGSKTGRPLVVQEREAENIPLSGLNIRSRAFMSNRSYNYEGEGPGEGDIQLKPLKVQSSVYVKFQIQ